MSQHGFDMITTMLLLLHVSTGIIMSMIMHFAVLSVLTNSITWNCYVSYQTYFNSSNNRPVLEIFFQFQFSYDHSYMYY